MKVAIFLCKNETMTDCFTLNLFGTNEPYGLWVKRGDLCLLYNYSDNSLYGVWMATSDGGRHNAAAWSGCYPNQVKIEQASKNIIRVLRTQIPTLMRDQLTIGKIYDGGDAQDLLQHFASVFDRQVTNQVAGRQIEDDYRNQYPAKFFCDDGHRVRSPGEKIIDDWFRRHDVRHDYESITAIPGLLPDFVVFSRQRVPVFIEFWGMSGAEYEARRLHKSRIYAQFMLPLIEIYPEHLQIIDAVLMNALNRHDVAYKGYA